MIGQAVFWAINTFVALSLPASVYAWIRLLKSRRDEGRGWYQLMPVCRRKPPFWSVAEFLILFGSMVVLTELTRQWFSSQGWLLTPTESDSSEATLRFQLAKIAIVSIAGIGALAITLAWLRLCCRDAWRELGFNFNRQDVRLGLIGALLILPPVLVISKLASLIQDYEHPTLQGLADAPLPLLFGSMFFATAVLTPILEELTYRVLLQGGLQGIADTELNDDGTWEPRSAWPLLVTSVLFAVMHVGQGAAYIPLFFFSLGLGYLYRQTGRFLPIVLIHLILNATTLCAEFARLQLPATT